jgi:hypothetical protein
VKISFVWGEMSYYVGYNDEHGVKMSYYVGYNDEHGVKMSYYVGYNDEHGVKMSYCKYKIHRNAMVRAAISLTFLLRLIVISENVRYT